MKFIYKRFANGIERPIIPIIVRNPVTRQSIRYLAFVDSGADVSIFAAEIGFACRSAEKIDFGT
jgi:hypothetical protein